MPIETKLNTEDQLRQELEIKWNRDLFLSNLDFSDLPTSNEIVMQGIFDIIAFRSQFSQLGERISRLDEVFLGVSPEQGGVVRSVLNDLSTEDRKQAIDFLTKRNYLVITENDENIRSVVNLRAAQKVIKLDRGRGKKTFPANLHIDDLNSIGNWLKDDPDEWLIGKNSKPMANRRLGLLSGYPHRSVEAFENFHQEGVRLFRELSQLGIDKETVISVFRPSEVVGSVVNLEILENIKSQIPEETWQALQKREKFVALGEFLACDQDDDNWRANVLLILQEVRLRFGITS